MFEVSVHSPAQFGALVAWLAVWRGPLSVLVHPNTTEPETELPAHDRERRNHTDRAMWMGERLPLDLSIFRPRTGAGTGGPPSAGAAAGGGTAPAPA
jgi:DOPA 4,5-dioxygenase